ncbi:MAG: NAD(+) synthase [Ruminococcaceae bacterium]|nr:NAD(+) synthase [Oscillospiraceae bacterium]
MNHGFVKIAVATPKIKVCDVEFNTDECIRLFNLASNDGAKVVLFPELALTGATCGDMFFSDRLISSALDGLRNFVYASAMTDTVAIIGLPMVCSDKLYSCAAVVQGGQILGIVPKTNISERCGRWFTACPDMNYSYMFDDNVLMFGNKQIFVCRNMPEFKFGVEFYDDLCAPVSPSCDLTVAGANMIFCPGSERYTVDSDKEQIMLSTAQSKKLACGYIIASGNMNESTTDGVFGGSAFICEDGEILAQKSAFGEELLLSEIDVNKLASLKRRSKIFGNKTAYEYCEMEFDIECEQTVLTRIIRANPFIPEDKNAAATQYEAILSIQAQGLAKRLVAAYAKKAVIGISGGLDSTLAIMVMARAMNILGRPMTDIVAVTMPCFGTTKRTKDNATVICRELGVDFRCVNISDSVSLHLKDIGHDINKHDVTYENAQARERTQVIMDIANIEGGFVVGTGDMSELALGWATYNGDHMSMYGVNASIPKTLVRELVSYCASLEEENGNKELADALNDVVGTPVSPELLPADASGNIAQKTEDLVGPYEIHDFYMYYMLKYGFTPSKLYRMAIYALGDKFDSDTLLKWLEVFVKRFFAQQFKRSCLPDGPAVTDISLSPRGGLVMPSDAVASLWIKEIQELKNN